MCHQSQELFRLPKDQVLLPKVLSASLQLERTRATPTRTHTHTPMHMHIYKQHLPNPTSTAYVRGSSKLLNIYYKKWAHLQAHLTILADFRRCFIKTLPPIFIASALLLSEENCLWYSSSRSFVQAFHTYPGQTLKLCHHKLNGQLAT